MSARLSDAVVGEGDRYDLENLRVVHVALMNLTVTSCPFTTPSPFRSEMNCLGPGVSSGSSVSGVLGSLSASRGAIN